MGALFSPVCRNGPIAFQLPLSVGPAKGRRDLTLLALLLGCQQQQKPDREELRDDWRHPGAGGAVVHPNSVTVAQGASPLLYRVQQPGTLHVTDMTSGSECWPARSFSPARLSGSMRTRAFLPIKRSSAPARCRAGTSIRSLSMKKPRKPGGRGSKPPDPPRPPLVSRPMGRDVEKFWLRKLVEPVAGPILL